jgi:hypothetical protein
LLASFFRYRYRGAWRGSWNYFHLLDIFYIKLDVRIGSKVDICTALDVGQLVKDDYFTLFESIGAIEV